LAIVGGPERPVIEGTGRYVMPALIDVHVHLNSSQDLQAYVFPGERETPRGIDDAH
jgi:imidazolonepropionase-like amidohydrolase